MNILQETSRRFYAQFFGLPIPENNTLRDYPDYGVSLIKKPSERFGWTVSYVSKQGAELKPLTSDLILSKYIENAITVFPYKTFGRGLPTLTIKEYTGATHYGKRFTISIKNTNPLSFVNGEFKLYKEMSSFKSDESKMPPHFIQLMTVDRLDIPMERMKELYESYIKKETGFSGSRIVIMKRIDNLSHFLGKHGKGPHLVSWDGNGMDLRSLDGDGIHLPMVDDDGLD